MNDPLPDQLTVCKSTGHAALDVAAAHVVHRTPTGSRTNGPRR
ncbi:hypothetical protein ACFWBB_37280 [Streptomyces sp. NPDC060000]